MEASGCLDVREAVFRGIAGRVFSARIIAERDGIVSGADSARKAAGELGIHLDHLVGEGARIRAGEALAGFRGTAERIAAAEEVLMGHMAKPSGIATAARALVDVAGGRPKVVCGAWKKMPPQIKETVRQAVLAGGASFRMASEPFVYLDKNYVRMLGGIRESLKAASSLSGFRIVIQVRGEYADVGEEACEAARCGASIVFVDTGSRGDLRRVSVALRTAGLRERVSIAFGGDVGPGDVAELKTMDVDILDIGKAIVDAPLLDMRMEVAEVGA